MTLSEHRTLQSVRTIAASTVRQRWIPSSPLQ
ncbi:hypothetical protein SAMN05444743_10646 [Pseudomonas sp. PDC86]|uniref:Uncharacterized protein n=1 Tax=Pseudomonas extremaustralis TaxID=359110 RepID=A0A5M9IYT7_9PSED|nr:hypothetical protein FX985_02020 [Pseudomonas extremaustralis]SDY84084.1 hypothetical protein SAMN05444743_10646 [Pseudomonas sp. PDC86]